MNIQNLHHVGIAVGNLAEAVSRWTSLLGAASGPVEENDAWGVRLAELRFETGPAIELVAPLDESSPVARFLAKRGQGLHHVALEVEDIEAAMADLRQKGVEFVSDRPRSGAGGSLTAFVHPRSLDGVLLELRQPGGKAADGTSASRR